MIQILTILFFIIGTAVGSFLNVVAYRSVHGGSVFFGSSICPKCKHKLGPSDLVPIVSFLLLNGRCRYCHKKISLQYPLVELATGLLFAFTFLHGYYLTNSINSINLIHLIYLLFIVSTLTVLFTTDLRSGLLPNSIVLPAIAAVAVFKIILLAFSDSDSVYGLSADLVASFLVASAFFAIVYLSRERALGGGDIKFVFLIALAVGWPALLVALWLAFLTGGLVAAMLILLGKKRFGQTVPLGPFLAFGGLIALLLGQQIIDLYLKGLYR
ncbi:MAG: hypothetical protein A2126_04785 [Candidatus Woykebacteria bacterium GWB1_45_5]|uniref:Prepilin leader peptidase/N-methyltransferase n=2 Tax=Candidatus Woykeibacteriota TaxID=1817899 RepID=A0A1G1W3H4_9BACT|nr:MAG: hypothetical protein A2113_03095 [Candidatus Woykebacteria bacterium GWA1_44_8]OGY24765.1 MAG: hypothetical protein A2126_04785 [Candidatus Woykebacteria bacterium GWB1_45_5]